MNAASPKRPSPDTRNAGAEYWQAAANGALLVPLCTECNRTFWHPRPRCPRCGSSKVLWRQSAGKGTIYTYTVVRQSTDPYFKAHLPYVVAMVTLDEGPRIMSNIVECDVDNVRIGNRVSVAFDVVAPNVGIPVFRCEETTQ